MLVAASVGSQGVLVVILAERGDACASGCDDRLVNYRLASLDREPLVVIVISVPDVDPVPDIAG